MTPLLDDSEVEAAASAIPPPRRTLLHECASAFDAVLATVRIWAKIEVKCRQQWDTRGAIDIGFHAANRDRRIRCDLLRKIHRRSENFGRSSDTGDEIEPQSLGCSDEFASEQQAECHRQP